jgi:hypothetical protein
VRGRGGEMTQTLHAHMNKINFLKKEFASKLLELIREISKFVRGKRKYRNILLFYENINS